MIGLYRHEVRNHVASTTNYISGVVHSYRELWSETFAPIDWEILILDRIKGGTYAEKKEQVHELAVQYSYMMDIPMSWYDVSEIGAWFEKYGRRYGLLEEFRENGIC